LLLEDYCEVLEAAVVSEAALLVDALSVDGVEGTGAVALTAGVAGASGAGELCIEGVAGTSAIEACGAVTMRVVVGDCRDAWLVAEATRSFGTSIDLVVCAIFGAGSVVTVAVVVVLASARTVAELLDTLASVATACGFAVTALFAGIAA
jgi:hypothetical protein